MADPSAPPATGYPLPPPQDYPPQGYPPPSAQSYPPPPAQGYPQAYSTPPPAQPSNVTVITSTNVVAGPVTYRESPVRTTCQFCHQEIITNTDRVTGLVTWLAAGGLCLLGCWLGCCLMPFCIDFCKDVEHRCPSCNNVVGVYRLIN